MNSIFLSPQSKVRVDLGWQLTGGFADKCNMEIRCIFFDRRGTVVLTVDRRTREADGTRVLEEAEREKLDIEGVGGKGLGFRQKGRSSASKAWVEKSTSRALSGVPGASCNESPLAGAYLLELPPINSRTWLSANTSDKSCNLRRPAPSR